MKRLLTASIIPLGISAFLLLMWFLLKDTTIDVLEPTGYVAEEQRKLIVFTVILSAFVVLPVFTLLGVFAYRYREGRGADYQPEVEGNNKLEALWWGIPIAIIGVLAVVTWQTSHSLDPYRKIQSENSTIEVQVIALQWKWLFLYPDYGVATVNELPIPVDHPIHFTLAADAPMSAFWIPSLGSQIYSMNGMSSELNLLAQQKGEFMGYNTNINGEGYADMTFTVKAMSAADFSSWTTRVATEGSTFSMHNYDKLAEPGLVQEPHEHRLADPDMYDTIVAKYMHSMSHDTTKKSDDSEHHGGHN